MKTPPIENAPPGDDFYTPPPLLPGDTHGAPIYQRRLDNPTAELACGDNWLVLYRSEDVHGKAIATSGIIALPRTEPPPGGFPVVTWAHGTVGVAHLCAPSRDTNASGAHTVNALPQRMLNHLLGRGWAVAMTDYEGLGTTDRTHPFLLGKSEAHGVLDIVRTARALFGKAISDRFAIVGHSQGGQAALFAAHVAHNWTPELRLAGVCAIAPANHPLEQVHAGAVYKGYTPGLAFTPLFLCGAIGGDPSIRPEKVLAPDVYVKRWPHVTERCRAGLSEEDSWGGIRGVEQFTPDYPSSKNEHQARFDVQLAAMNPDVSLTVPVRIAQAADDDRVQAKPEAYPGTDRLVKELNATNPRNHVEYVRYPEGVVKPDALLGVHFGTINHDAPALMDWLTARFDQLVQSR